MNIKEKAKVNSRLWWKNDKDLAEMYYRFAINIFDRSGISTEYGLPINAKKHVIATLKKMKMYKMLKSHHIKGIFQSYTFNKKYVFMMSKDDSKRRDIDGTLSDVKEGHRCYAKMIKNSNMYWE